MADSRRLLLSLIDKLLNDVRLAAGEAKSLGRVVAHICHIDTGDAQSAAVYLKERGFSGHADRLTRDVEGLRQKADEAFRGPFVAEPTPDDRKQERRCLGALHSEAQRLLQFLNELRSLVDEDDDAVTTECEPAVGGEDEAACAPQDAPCCVAKSPSGRVVLYGRADKPRVDGKERDKLTAPQYDVVCALLKSGETGLTKDQLEGKETGRGGGRGILKRLAKKAGWKAVIGFAETTGSRYRIL